MFRELLIFLMPTDAVKARADYVTTTNTKDGVAAAIEHFIL